jgi:hypothetical protein
MAFRSPSLPRALSAAAAAAALLSVTACSAQVSVENADVPSWKATALPPASGTVAEDAGKLLNAQPVDRTAEVPAGSYTLTLVCEGGGKAFLAVRSAGKELADLGAACYGTRESAKLTLTESGTLEFSASSLDAPLIYAYRLVAAG